MKKTLLTISAGLLLSLGSFAQTYPESVVADGEQDNGTNVGSFWFAYPNTTQGKSSTILINAKAVDGTSNLETSTGGKTGNCLSASGTLAKTAGPDYESAGMGFALAPIEATIDEVDGSPTKGMVTNPEAVQVDLSQAQGIKFWYKSTASKLIIGVFTTNITQNAGHDYFIELPAAADWTEFTVCFPGSELEGIGVPVLAQPDWLGTKTTWDGSKVFKLQFQVKDVDGDYSFSVDDVTIIGAEIANKVALSDAWYALQDWIAQPENNATAEDEAKLAAALLVLNDPMATQAEVDASEESILLEAPVVDKAALTTVVGQIDTKITALGDKVTQTHKDKVAAAKVVLNNATATQEEVDASKVIMDALLVELNGIVSASELTADLAVTANEIVISAAKTISSVSLVNAAGAVVSKVSVGSSVATVSTAAAQGTTVVVIVYADGSVESTTFVK